MDPRFREDDEDPIQWIPAFAGMTWIHHFSKRRPQRVSSYLF